MSLPTYVHFFARNVHKLKGALLIIKVNLQEFKYYEFKTEVGSYIESLFIVHYDTVLQC